MGIPEPLHEKPAQRNFAPFLRCTCGTEDCASGMSSRERLVVFGLIHGLIKHSQGQVKGPPGDTCPLVWWDEVVIARVANGE